MSKPVFQDIFSFAGRRNRQSYFLYGLSVTFALIVLGLLAMAAIPSDAMYSNARGRAMMNDMNPALILLAAVLVIPLIFSSVLVGAQRCRDFGWTGWAILISVIPYIGFIFSLVTLFIPGTNGPNRYGPDPLQGASH